MSAKAEMRTTDAARPAIPSSFGDLLRRQRLDAGLIQEDLAERATMSARGISDLERGARSRPHRDTARLLADGLGLEGPQRSAFLAAARHGAARPRSSLPSPSATSGASFPQASLPVPPNPLLGRTEEVATAVAILREPDVRLLTLTGAGGSGKTRLAIEVASRLRADFPGGVAFVNLAPLVDPALVPAAIAAAVGVREQPGRTLMQAIGAALVSRRVLLILDNFEHLLPGAVVAGDLIASAPTLTILATSHARLALAAERELPVPPLAVPDPLHLPPLEQLEQIGAVRLFVTRARGLQPDFAFTAEQAPSVAAICQRLDGLPLAIELAAARVKMLPPVALLARLDQSLPLLTAGSRDMPERQRTLRNTIAWSHDLLNEEERALFRRLAVFGGGWTLEAADAVANLDGGLDVLAGMAALIDMSLVRRIDAVGDEPRYGMLETIREFALELLAASGEEARIRDAHAAHFLTLAERAEPVFFGTRPGAMAAQLSADHDNVVGALRWREQSADVTAAARLAAALRDYWFFAGHWGEGRRWLDWVIARLASVPEDVAGRVLWAAGFLALLQGDDRGCVPLLERGRELLSGVGDDVGEMQCVYCLGEAALDRGDFDEAQRLLAEAHDGFRRLDDPFSAIIAECQRAIACLRQGDLDSAATWAEAAYNRSIALRLIMGVRYAAMVLVELELARDNHPGAAAWFRRALMEPESLGKHSSEKHEGFFSFSAGASPMVVAAALAVGCGEWERGARLFGAADRWRESMGVRGLDAREMAYAEAARGPRSSLGEAGFDAAWAAGRDLQPPDVRAEIEAVLQTALATTRSP